MNAKHLFALGFLLLVLGNGPAQAQTASYHLQRLKLQAQEFLQDFGTANRPSLEAGVPLDSQLQQTTEHSVWAHQMVLDDVQKIVETSQEWTSKLSDATADELQAARTSIESLARRLRISSAAVELAPRGRTSLDFLFLELQETSQALELQKAQVLAQEASKRRSRVGIGFGLGYGYGYGYPAWGYPWGVGRYHPYGYGFGPGPWYPGLPYHTPGHLW